MLPASATTILAVPDRPGLERPEVKDPDGSDGQFAGLMAQFSQAPLHRDPLPDRTAEAPVRDASDATDRPAKAAAAAPATGPDRPSPATDATDRETKAEAKVQAPETPGDPAGTGASKTPDSATPAKASESPSPQVSPTPATPPKAVPAGLIPDLPAMPRPSEVPATDPAALESPATPPLEAPPEATPAIPKAPAALALVPTSPAPAKAAGEPSKAAAPTVPGAAAEVSSTSTPVPGPLPAKGGQGSKAALPAEEAPRPTAPAASGILPGQEKAPGVPGGPQVSEGPEPPAPGPAKAEPDLLKPVLLKGSGTLLTSPQGEPAPSSLAALGAPKPLAVPVPVAASSPASAPPAAPTPAMAQVEGSLRWMLKSGSQEARLQLHPESLGQVTIHLKVEGGEVHARLWVTEPASVQAVQEGRPHLEQSLKEQGLQLGSFDLQQGHRPFQEAPATPTFRGPVSDRAAGARQETPAAPAPTILNAHRVELYA